MDYKTALHMAALVLDLLRVANREIKVLFEYPDNEVESVRLKCNDTSELVIAQRGGYTLIVQQFELAVAGDDGGEEGDEAAAS
jgi:hypothetical protein